LQGIEDTKTNDRMTLILALNYSARWEMTHALKRVVQGVQMGDIAYEDITEATISDHLTTADFPDPELMIRTSGEHRISNFFLWQAAYSEMYFTDILWPDFNENSFNQALISYAQRDRRFGGAVDQVDSINSVSNQKINSK